MYLKCRRCSIGIDNDGDGNCGVCAKWPDEELASKLAAFIYLITDGKSFLIEILPLLRKVK